MKINIKSMFVSGILTGVIIMLIGAGVVALAGNQMDKALENLSVPPLSKGARVYFAATSLVLGIAIMGIYALIQHKFKSKLKAAVTVSLTFWVFTYFWSNAALVAYGFLPFKLVAERTGWGLLELLIATLLGSILYKPKESQKEMKAVICTQYGPPEVLQIKEVEKPKPKDNEVLIKIYATTAHIGDTRIRRVDPFLVRLIFGLFKPKKNLILGLEISGIIESVGKNVKSFKKGDKIFALTGFGGGYAEYLCLPEKAKEGTLEVKGLVAFKPENLTYKEAATIPAGGLTALKNLQKSNIGKGHRILINGASGSLGTYAIQLAKYYGAEVTAVCSTENFELVKSIGADKVIDYKKEDFTKNQEKYDIVYDAAMKLKASKCSKILKSNGFFLNNSGLPKINEEDLLFLKELIENNKLKPVIDRTYSIEEIVEAHRYVDKGHKKGNVAVTLYDE